MPSALPLRQTCGEIEDSAEEGESSESSSDGGIEPSTPVPSQKKELETALLGEEKEQHGYKTSGKKRKPSVIKERRRTQRQSKISDFLTPRKKVRSNRLKTGIKNNEVESSAGGGGVVDAGREHQTAGMQIEWPPAPLSPPSLPPFAGASAAEVTGEATRPRSETRMEMETEKL